MTRTLSSLALALALALGAMTLSAQPAEARRGGGLVAGLVVGAVVGGIIANEIARKQRKRYYYAVSPSYRPYRSYYRYY